MVSVTVYPEYEIFWNRLLTLAWKTHPKGLLGLMLDKVREGDLDKAPTFLSKAIPFYDTTRNTAWSRRQSLNIAMAFGLLSTSVFDEMYHLEECPVEVDNTRLSVTVFVEDGDAFHWIHSILHKIAMAHPTYLTLTAWTPSCMMARLTISVENPPTHNPKQLALLPWLMRYHPRSRWTRDTPVTINHVEGWDSEEEWVEIERALRPYRPPRELEWLENIAIARIHLGIPTESSIEKITAYMEIDVTHDVNVRQWQRDVLWERRRSLLLWLLLLEQKRATPRDGSELSRFVKGVIELPFDLRREVLHYM